MKCRRLNAGVSSQPGQNSLAAASLKSTQPAAEFLNFKYLGLTYTQQLPFSTGFFMIELSVSGVHTTYCNFGSRLLLLLQVQRARYVFEQN